MTSSTFNYWNYLPSEIQSKIFSYFKNDIPLCIRLLRVSRLFKKNIELLHIDIYSVSLGLRSKKFWYIKTYPLFDHLIRQLKRNNVTFDKVDVMAVYLDGSSLFGAFLHLFCCIRSCDNVRNYCNVCSHVRLRNFQKQRFYDDVVLEQREHFSKIGLEDRLVDFDVFLPDFHTYYVCLLCGERPHCRRRRVLKHPADLFIVFLSTFARINLSNCYDFFLNVPLTLNQEKYVVSQISNFVRDISFEVWKLNVNYFFEIFDIFNILNRSCCYQVRPIEKKLKYKPLCYSEGSTYYGELSVIPRENYHLFNHNTHSSESE